MNYSKLASNAYAAVSTPTDMPPPLQMLGEIYAGFGARFRPAGQSRVGRDVKGAGSSIDLGIGEYFDCAPEIVEAAIESLREGKTRYLTLETLRESVARKYADEQKVQIDPRENVLLMGGARPGIALSMLAVVDPGDRVIIPDPDYIGLTHMASALGAQVVRSPMRRNADGSLTPDLERIEHDAKNGVRAIALTNPNNPVGCVWSRDQLSELSRIAERAGAFVIVNEIYDGLVYAAPEPFVSYVSVGNLERAYVIGGPAKVYDMTGFGVGWLVGGRENIVVTEDLIFLTHQAMPDAPSQYAALAALTSPVREEVPARARARLYANAQSTVRAIDGVGSCRCPMPAAGQFAFPWIGGDDLRFAKFLKERMKLSVVPGSAWGAQGKGHLRIALANAEELQQEGLRRLREGLEQYEEA